MPTIPEPLSLVNSIDGLLEALEQLSRRHVSARFAVYPVTDGQVPDGLLHYDQWLHAQLLSQSPYLARLVLSEATAESPVAGTPVSDAPVAFAVGVGSCVVLCSVAKAELFGKMTTGLVRGHFPRLGHAFWDTGDLLGLLRMAAQGECESFRLTRLSYRSPGIQRSPQNQRRDRDLDSQQKWTDLDLDEAELELRTQDAWLRSAEFRCVWRDTHGGEALRVIGSAARDSTFSARSAPSVVWRNMVVPAAEHVAARRRIFADRQRGEHYERAPRPLAIRYDDPVFEQASQNRLLVAALRGLPDAAVSVYHANPYLHATVVDYLDGSSVDVWVVNADRITLVPGARATTSALERLAAHVMDEFREGEVTEPQPARERNANGDP